VQSPTIAPREAYTVAEITDLIRDTPAREIGSGLELIGMDLEVEEDITDWLGGGSVGRESFANLHGSAGFDLLRPLDWGSSLVRPYYTIDGVRFDLGAYFTSVPTTDVSRSPVTYSVEGFDILLRLANRVGSSYSVASGDAVLTAVEAILVAQGFTRYVIDPQQAAAVMPAARVWPIDDNTTWLTVVNDLLASVGYAGIWSDWYGRLRCEAYTSPRDRAAEWVYLGEGDEVSSQLSVQRVVHHDYFDTPNRWIACRQNNIEGATPEEGDGLYTYTNELDGPTSVEARGRVITGPLILVDAVDQTALETAVAQRVAADISVPTTIELSLPLANPLHWHFDRCYVVDDALGMHEVLVTKWILPLAPSTADQTMSWTVLT
jgi:hypothetical protein